MNYFIQGKFAKKGTNGKQGTYYIGLCYHKEGKLCLLSDRKCITQLFHERNLDKYSC